MTDENASLEGSSDEKELSLRDQIEAARDEVEAADNPAEKAEPEKAEPATPEPEKADPDEPPPNSWAADAKAKWGDIPQEARQYIARREAEMHRAITAQDDLKTAGKAIRELVSPYQDLFAEMPDIKPPALIKGYLETEKTLRRGTPEQKAQLIGNVIKAYGLDLNLLGQALNAEQPIYRPDPRVETLEQRLARFEAEAEQRQEKEKLSVIEKFMTDNQVTEQHIDEAFIAEFEAVRRLNPQLNEAESLQKAWDRHSWATPELRKAHIEKQHQDTSKQEALNRARRAGASVTGSPGLGTENDKPLGSLREELERNYGRLTGRV